VLGQNYAALLAAYGAFTVAHLAANAYSMRCVQFLFMNRQRLALCFEAMFEGRPTPTPADVSKLERIILPPWIGFEGNAVEIGSRVTTAVSSVSQLQDAVTAFKGERFVVTRSTGGKLHVMLRRNASSEDSARAYYVVQKLRLSTGCTSKNGTANIASMPPADYDKAVKAAVTDMRHNFGRFMKSCRASGWTTDRFLLEDSTVRVDW
jgi:hypothetical protein